MLTLSAYVVMAAIYILLAYSLLQPLVRRYRRDRFGSVHQICAESGGGPETPAPHFDRTVARSFPPHCAGIGCEHQPMAHRRIKTH